LEDEKLSEKFSAEMEFCKIDPSRPRIDLDCSMTMMAKSALSVDQTSLKLDLKKISVHLHYTAPEKYT
jgi:hypothetical protein